MLPATETALSSACSRSAHEASPKTKVSVSVAVRPCKHEDTCQSMGMAMIGLAGYSKSVHYVRSIVCNDSKTKMEHTDLR